MHLAVGGLAAMSKEVLHTWLREHRRPFLVGFGKLVTSEKSAMCRDAMLKISSALP